MAKSKKAPQPSNPYEAFEQRLSRSNPPNLVAVIAGDSENEVLALIRWTPGKRFYEYHYKTRVITEIIPEKGDRTAWKIIVKRDCLYKQYSSAKIAKMKFEKLFKNVKDDS